MYAHEEMCVCATLCVCVCVGETSVRGVTGMARRSDCRAGSTELEEEEEEEGNVAGD